MAVERADNFASLPPTCYPGVGPRYCGKRRIDMLRFHTLGSFELLEGQPPAVRLIPTQPKRLALLAYLALAHPRGPHRRDTLLALFWPELSAEEARRALRQALHHLRRAVAEGAIETRADDQVRFQEGCLWCDALAFQAAVAEGRPDEALALYRNGFLAGVHVPEVSVELEEWIEQTRARLHQTAGQAAVALSQRAEQAGDLPGAVEAARVACDLQPDDEACARRLMQLLERQGDRALALQVYERLGRRLQSEYQTAPSKETAALARSLREVRRDDRAPASATAPEMVLPAPEPATAAASRAPPRARWLVPALLLSVVVLLAFLFLATRRPVPTLSTGELAAGGRVIAADSEHGSGDRPSGNPEAHTLYLKGRYFWNKRTQEDIQTALHYFQQAVDLDPGYAPAWVGIADTWIFWGWYSRLAPQETFPRAKRAVMMALEFDSTLAEAHASLAHIHLEFDHDWDAAEREYRRAIELDPEYPIAHHWYGGFLSAMGRHREALQHAETARALDPLSLIIQTWVGLRYYFAGEYEAAIAEYRKALELDRDFAPAHWHLGWVYAQTGHFKEAVSEAKRAVAIDGGNLAYLASLGHAYARAGRTSEARATLARLARASSSWHVSAYHVAAIHVALGDTNSGLDWLERAYEEQSPWIGYVGVDPRFEALRSHPRFESLLRKARLRS
jgi:DNA-binding SARP family transcriptional activator/Tfp pilus assembly protein PilF